ncbi:MAG: polysaccharide deacetylase [Pseudonocardia sp.]|nr:polysaccharide deacetylase [Pseudonocardia sp.]
MAGPGGTRWVALDRSGARSAILDARVAAAIAARAAAGAAAAAAAPPAADGTPPQPPEPRPPEWMRPLGPGETPPQFVLFSFDGVGSHEHWQRVLALAESSGASITGFLSGVYLLEDARRAEYRGPGRAPGRSSIGFGGTTGEVDTLVGDLNRAVAAGHEIGTHYNGHFCQGSPPSVGDWTTAMWDDELDQFFAFVTAARARGLTLDPATIKGGRTPCLEGDWAQAYPSMRAHGLTYDSSRTSNGIAWPSDEGGIREFPMPLIRIPALGRKVILMDYNLWYSLNGARDEPNRAAEFTADTLEAYHAAFDAAYHGNRAPLVIGNHFNNWSGGAFSAAVEALIPDLCVRPGTVCATYSQVSAWIDLQDPAVLDVWRAKPAAQVPAT